MIKLFEFLPEDYEWVDAPLYVEAGFTLHEGGPARMNYGGLPDPAEPATYEVYELRIEDGPDLSEAVDDDTFEKVLDVIYETPVHEVAEMYVR